MKNFILLFVLVLASFLTSSCVEDPQLYSPIEQEKDISKTEFNKCYSCTYEKSFNSEIYCGLTVVEMEKLKRDTPSIIECYKVVD